MNENDSNATDSINATSSSVETQSSDPSKRVVQWGDGRTPDPEKICTARRSDGTPCRKQRVTGAVVCATHGGRAPQVKAKARVRLEMAGDKLARELLKIAMDDPDVPAAVKLQAIRDALSRIGITEQRAVSVEVSPAPGYEALLDEMLGGSRAESRARRGQDNPNTTPAWLADELGTLDAEVVDEDEPVSPPPFSPPAPEPVASEGLMSMEDALDQLRHTGPPPVPQSQQRWRS